MGAGWATVFSAPQFLCLGPIYHLAKEKAGPTVGMFCAAVTETVISYVCSNSELEHIFSNLNHLESNFLK